MGCIGIYSTKTRIMWRAAQSTRFGLSTVKRLHPERHPDALRREGTFYWGVIHVC